MRKLKNKLIIFLFSILDVPDATPSDKDAKQIERWLADSWGDPGFIAYSRERSKQLVKTIADGVGMEELPRDSYVRMVGQRFEQARFILVVKKAYQKREGRMEKKKDKEKLKNKKE